MNPYRPFSDQPCPIKFQQSVDANQGAGRAKPATWKDRIFWIGVFSTVIVSLVVWHIETSRLDREYQQMTDKISHCTFDDPTIELQSKLEYLDRLLEIVTQNSLPIQRPAPCSDF